MRTWVKLAVFVVFSLTVSLTYTSSAEALIFGMCKSGTPGCPSPSGSGGSTPAPAPVPFVGGGAGFHGNDTDVSASFSINDVGLLQLSISATGITNFDVAVMPPQAPIGTNATPYMSQTFLNFTFDSLGTYFDDTPFDLIDAAIREIGTVFDGLEVGSLTQNNGALALSLSIADLDNYIGGSDSISIDLPDWVDNPFAGAEISPELISFINSDNFGFCEVTAPDFTRAPVPEPSTLVLLGIGVVGFGVARLRKKKSF